MGLAARGSWLVAAHKAEHSLSSSQSLALAAGRPLLAVQCTGVQSSAVQCSASRPNGLVRRTVHSALQSVSADTARPFGH